MLKSDIGLWYGNCAMVNQGLQGVVAGESKIGFVDGTNGILMYRGYPIDVLAKNSNYLETSHLLLFGSLPNRQQLKTFTDTVKKKRKLPREILKIIRILPTAAHPMELLQTITAAMGIHETMDTKKIEKIEERSIELIAQFPTIVAACWRAKQKQKIISPHPKLGHSANFLYMITGNVPDPLEAQMFDTCLVLHAEHSFNVSTFTARVVASSLPSLHASISAAVGALYGPLHGGANEKVLKMISEIKSPDQVETWVQEKLSRKEKIMGMGHRVYQVKDPRSYVLEEMLATLSKKKNDTKYYELLKKIEEIVQRESTKKGKYLWPNVDFFSGALYKLMGIPEILFTPVFAIARIAGWSAHVIEQMKDNRIIRPDCDYTGAKNLSYIPMAER